MVMTLAIVQGPVMLHIGLVLSDGMITAYLTDLSLPCNLQFYLIRSDNFI